MTGTLNVILTHLPAAAVDEGVRNLRRIAPESRFAICHGGSREDFDLVDFEDKIFVDDPTLRGPPQTYQSYNLTLAGVAARWVSGDPSIKAVYIFEYDHLVLRPDFDSRLRSLAEATKADFMGKTCVERTGTNWEHYGRFRGDKRLLEHLRRLSVREDATRMFGCIGNGFWLTREALTAYAAVEPHPLCYGELYVPTLLYHLGFNVVDIDRHSDIYRHVRWSPPWAYEEVEDIKREGGFFIHPVKDVEAIARALADEGALSGPETAPHLS